MFNEIPKKRYKRGNKLLTSSSNYSKKNNILSLLIVFIKIPKVLGYYLKQKHERFMQC